MIMPKREYSLRGSERAMDEEGIGRVQHPEKIPRKDRLARREQVNRIKGSAFYLNSGRTVRLQGLKACREASGLSQRQLAKLVGTNQTTISDLEERYAHRGAYVFTIRRLCEALEVAPADLICNREGPDERVKFEKGVGGKGLDREEQLNALRNRMKYVPKDEMTDGGWKVQLAGLKACRLAAGLTQRGLAEMIGKGQTSIADMENRYRGYSGAYLYMVRRLCRALKVLPADLICGAPVK
jgi:transcriptional regulator with XRE-family HTH domain